MADDGSPAVGKDEGSSPSSPQQSDGLLSSMTDALATPQEAALLLNLRQELASDLVGVLAYPDVVGDLRLLRTLRAFNHSIDDCAFAFRAHLEVRHKNDMNAVRQRIVDEWGDNLWNFRAEDAPHGQIICRYMPEVVVFSKSRQGDPVGLGLWGQGRPQDFVAEVEDWQTKFFEYYCYMNEAKMLLLEQASREQQRLVHFVQVFDLENWTIMSNSDPAWTSFTMDVCRPVGETYHDCNACFVAIRTTNWARMAYKMIKQAIPKKVTAKISVLGDDFSGSKTLGGLLDERAMLRLGSRNYTSTSTVQEGRAILRPRHTFELQVEVPCGGAVSWHCAVLSDRRGREGCMPLSLNFSSPDLVFSTTSSASSSGGGDDAEPLPVLEDVTPRRMQGDTNRGRLPVEGADGRTYCVTMRWENRHALLTAKTLDYRIEVELPVTSPKGTAVVASGQKQRKPPMFGRSLAFYFVGVLCILLAVFAGAQRQFLSAYMPRGPLQLKWLVR